MRYHDISKVARINSSGLFSSPSRVSRCKIINRLSERTKFSNFRFSRDCLNKSQKFGGCALSSFGRADFIPNRIRQRAVVQEPQVPWTNRLAEWSRSL